MERNKTKQKYKKQGLSTRGTFTAQGAKTGFSGRDFGLHYYKKLKIK